MTLPLPDLIAEGRAALQAGDAASLQVSGDRRRRRGRPRLARAQTLLGDTGESPERGWVALNIGMFEGDRPRKEERFRHALEVARSHGDSDLEFVALAYLGASVVHSDRTEEGMTLLDEALAAVAGSDVDDFCVLEEIFCQRFSACEHAHDVGRADQWIRIGETIAQRRQLPAVSAFCRTHYGGILTAAGRWPEADLALTEAVRLWGLGQQSMRGERLCDWPTCEFARAVLRRPNSCSMVSTPAPMLQ